MPDAIAAVRAFDRFYTGRLGVLGPGFLRTPHTLGEARVLYELAQAPELPVAELRRRMAIDAGQLSRLLARLEKAGLVARERVADDRRRQLARLTPAGTQAAALLDRRAVEQTGARLARLAGADRARLIASLADVRRLLDPEPPPAAVVLRSPRPGDLGWVICRNGRLYAEEHGWNAEYEALVARIVADYAQAPDPEREAIWIAEVDGEPAGCIFCVCRSETVAQLRLLLVEPRARGLGLGARLVDECVSFARRAGYREMVLWTQDILVAARRIYQRAGFALTGEERHRSFGHDLTGQTWSLPL